MYTISEYQRLAMVTANKSLSKRDWQCNAYTGLVGEVAELFELLYSDPRPNATPLLYKELGDVAWYIAAICDAFSLDITQVFATNSWESLFGGRVCHATNQHNRLVCASGIMVDYLKKVFFHGHTLDTSKLTAMLGEVAANWVDLCVIHAGSATAFDLVVNANIEKLKARYPEGFNTLASQTRKD